MSKIAAIILAGGNGTRLKTTIPKPFLQLEGKIMAAYSVEAFLQCCEIAEIIIVAQEQFHDLFSAYPVRFANPGKRRQDSLFNGLGQVSEGISFICVHDAARPFITVEMLKNLCSEGKKVGAATVAVPVKSTIKYSSCGFVDHTLERSKIYEIQTPQFISKSLLQKGFLHTDAHQITVTDDVSFAELIGHPVKLVEGSYSNIKITTPEDLLIAKAFLA